MGMVRALDHDRDFQPELAMAGMKLVIVDFTATWCQPCQRIAPVFQQLSAQYPNAVFLKVDVDKLPETAASQNVSSMPTFIFYRNRSKIDMCQGNNPSALEAKIIEHYVRGGDDEAEGPVAGHMDLSTYIIKSQCECLNESDDHNLEHGLTAEGSGYLESDCDEQLIISITFRQAVKIHSLAIKAPADKGPKNLKLFINQPRTIDFDMADSNTSVQDLTLTPKDIEEGNPVALRYVKFQNVLNLQIFVKDNQGGCETTQIDHLAIYGSPILTTNMGDFKRVAGKKGESH
ncbi:thioredoxin-like protein 1 [Microplitis mediator]|uniref:thioredoxin-like protein 1 n=1 Tax=Microplitis mediator TaxID=375433 RepID=UPI002555ECDC|nr:thioredoxin-like protein 1 [Microplitis mediator]